MVLTTARIGGRELPQERRMDRLDDILARVPSEKGAITTSRLWKLPARERERPVWVLGGLAGPGAERVLSEAGVDVEVGRFGQYLHFTLPEQYMQAVPYIHLMQQLKDAV